MAERLARPTDPFERQRPPITPSSVDFDPVTHAVPWLSSQIPEKYLLTPGQWLLTQCCTRALKIPVEALNSVHKPTFPSDCPPAPTRFPPGFHLHGSRGSQPTVWVAATIRSSPVPRAGSACSNGLSSRIWCVTGAPAGSSSPKSGVDSTSNERTGNPKPGINSLAYQPGVIPDLTACLLMDFQSPIHPVPSSRDSLEVRLSGQFTPPHPCTALFRLSTVSLPFRELR